MEFFCLHDNVFCNKNTLLLLMHCVNIKMCIRDRIDRQTADRQQTDRDRESMRRKNYFLHFGT